MNKTAIKNFAIYARNKLIEETTYKAGMYGVTADGIAAPLPQSTADMKIFDIGTKNYAEVSGTELHQREALVREIQSRAASSDYRTVFDSVIEEVAYTWFNRMIAIRFMEVNDYLPSGVRALSSDDSAKSEPDIVTKPFDAELDFTAKEQEFILQCKDDNRLDGLFRMLFIKQCNALHDILPELFEKTDDYTELLLTISFTDKDGVVRHLVDDISEGDFDVSRRDDDGNMTGQFEIIGWLYQYYISDKHDEIVNIYKGTVKKEDIPAATQLFTTDWVVKYMVDNSLGRFWIERNPQSKLADKLQFFVTPKDGNIEYIDEKIEPDRLTFFDPCMGSGHILVYAFDVLMEIYLECGYSERDAAVSIAENNLFGLDIDKRAYQLAYFSLMMKVRSHNRRALSRGVRCNVAAIEESNGVEGFYCSGLTDDVEQNKTGEYLVELYRDAKETGSMLRPKSVDIENFSRYIEEIEQRDDQIDFVGMSWLENTLPLIKCFIRQTRILEGRYNVVCTNPPYLNKYNTHLKKFVKDTYKDYSGDLFSVFMYHNFDFCIENGYCAFMTPFVWMFIKTYENLRQYIIENKSISTLVQMEYSAYEEATVPICSFVLKNGAQTSKGLYFKLSDFKGGMQIQKEKVLEALENKNCGYFYESDEKNFTKIPGMPIAYWLVDNDLSNFEGEKLGAYVDARIGMITGDNSRFLRFWYEVAFNTIGFNMSSNEESVKSRLKWFPYNKGGNYRKWYGNNEYIVNWFNDGYEMKNDNFSGSRVKSHNYNGGFGFKEGISWSSLTSGSFSCRYSSKGFLFDAAGPLCMVLNNKNLWKVLGYLLTKVSDRYLQILNPTINMHPGYLEALPYKDLEDDVVDKIIEDMIFTSKSDWDAFETSWDFKRHPLV